MIYDPYTTGLVGTCYVDDVWFCRYFDPALQRIQQAFEDAVNEAGLVQLTSWSMDRKRFIVKASGPRNPGSYYLYDTAKGPSLLGRAHPRMTPAELGEMLVIKYPARDGTKIPGYLTLPAGKGSKNLPMVVMPHGGPELRDYVTFDNWAQMFANRGYAVFQPNFRGSGGYGKRYLEAGYRQWGRLMQDDITDGVKALIKDGTADPNRICIVGASYGGYAALAGGAFTPELYKCVVSIAGVSDLVAMIENDRFEGGGRDSFRFRYWKTWVGDPRTDAQEMKAFSPVSHAAKFTAPVLLIHGREDDNVVPTQSLAMEKALKKAGKPVEYILVDYQGHSFVGPARLDLLKNMERFVATHIGK
jgi:dipeptidyl aminopeptidase/acylaminoacyl peptidase